MPKPFLDPNIHIISSSPSLRLSYCCLPSLPLSLSPMKEACTYICIYMYVCTYIYIHICMYIYIYIQTHTLHLWISCVRHQTRVCCCSVLLQCVAVRCSVLQCVVSGGRCTHTHTPSLDSVCVSEHESVLQCIAVHCSALQCIAVHCSALQCVAVRCSVSFQRKHTISG